jgi:hypothetical protein
MEGIERGQKLGHEKKTIKALILGTVPAPNFYTGFA